MTHSRRHASGTRRSSAGADLFQPAPLLAVIIEIDRVEPFLVGAFQRGPFGVDNRIPGCVAILSLDYHVLAKHALGFEAKPLGCALRRLVAVVTFPFPAAVAEVLEGVPHEQIVRLGAGRVSSNGRSPVNMATLDPTMGWFYAHEGLPTGRLARRLI